MKLKFCGAARNVTGSSHLVTLNDGTSILLDCGLFQGKGRDVWESNNSWLFDPETIDILVLSHAHIDHSGRLPKLVKDGFRGRILSTHATRSLCAIMLADSAYIQVRDVEYYNKRLLRKRRKSKWKELREPLYTQEDVERTMELFVSYPYDQWLQIHDDVKLLFRDAGHILGSSSIALEITEGDTVRKLAFTGDIGRPDRPILRDPRPMPESDYVICESTYGDRVHEDAPSQSGHFLDVIRRTCVEKRGKLIIPAFSVGRTQEIIYMLDRLEHSGVLPQLPVYVDSPLAVNATEVFRLHPECFDSELNAYLHNDPNPFGFGRLHYVRDVEESKRINVSQEPCIIVSSSGMMNFGRIRHHMYHNIEDPRNTFLIVGYCAPDTAGGQLRAGAEALKILGDWKMVNAEVEVMDSFSAHGDRDEMLNFISNQRNSAECIFLVHGEFDTQESFGSFLESEGFADIEIPFKGQEFIL